MQVTWDDLQPTYRTINLTLYYFHSERRYRLLHVRITILGFTYPWISPRSLEHRCDRQDEQISKNNWNGGMNVDPQPWASVRTEAGSGDNFLN